MLITYSEKSVNNYQGPVGKEYLFSNGGVYEIIARLTVGEKLNRLITWDKLTKANMTAKEYVDSLA